ncbi:MAG: hypothetical protein ACK559_14500, partial [bacterium]
RSSAGGGGDRQGHREARCGSARLGPPAPSGRRGCRRPPPGRGGSRRRAGTGARPRGGCAWTG